MIHSAHTHVGHGQQRWIPQRGHRRAGTGPAGERRNSHARSVHALGDDRMRLAGRFNDDVVCLGGPDLELFDLDRSNVEAVGADDPELHSRDAHVEEAHRAAVDDADPHALPAREQVFQALLGPVAVGEVGIGRARHVEDVGWHHPHLSPHPAFFTGQRIVVGERALLVVKVALALLQLRHDRVRMHRREFAEQHHVVGVGLHRIGPGRIDDDWSVVARLLLQARVAVPPVCARLTQRGHLVGEGLSGPDAGEAHAGHAIELERDKKAMPVDRTVLVERIGDVEVDRLAFLEPHEWTGNASVHGDPHSAATLHREGAAHDIKIDAVARNLVEALPDCRTGHVGTARPGRHRGRGPNQATCRQARSKETASIDVVHHLSCINSFCPFYAAGCPSPHSSGIFSFSVFRAR